MTKRSPVTTHVLDLSKGQPAANLNALLEIQKSAGWAELGKGATNPDGRIDNLLSPHHPLTPGNYRLTFLTGEYFAAQKINSFYPSVTVTFRVGRSDEHHHVPLLLSPYGYSTYRGS
jgi:5-hydroxyisourate hydrolase